jgi:hypothetical protein
MKKLFINRIGEEKINKDNLKVTIINYKSWTNIDVQFEDGTILYGKSYNSFKTGKIKNPMSPTLFGLGFIGVGEYKSKLNGEHTKEYIAWINIFKRCYDEERRDENFSYKDCTVDERWHNFQNFAQWFEENYRRNQKIDKDILVKGNKVYSPETCRFVPIEINNLFTNRKRNRGEYPIGVTFCIKSGKYIAQIQKYSKTIYLGQFDNPEDAFLKYKIEKELWIKEVANQHRQNIDEDLLESMLNWSIDIYD